MKKFVFFACWAGTLAIAGISLAGPIERFETHVSTLAPMDSKLFREAFKGGQRASAIAIGDGSSYMGLYVYDLHGNCVAWDDEGIWRTRDDLAVEWYPYRTAVYIIEVHNSGIRPNAYKVVMR